MDPCSESCTYYAQSYSCLKFLWLFIQEEIEIEGKTLRVGKALGVVSVELRKKKSGKIIAQGRHTKYLPVPSKM